ncbi:serine protease [Acinetobacter baumannii]|uniref:S1 family peptidase n=1 Tax=Acinetobacter baumannii TaxID=470 RepID=UPI001CA7EF64|nr:serine protease [Acinetobacter baumannii]MEB6557586.1 serine protease [Acinetobacter baumannii]UAB17538.1 trypsin-like peptidase domain-containing protein [Acinetobacter baumannii]
MDFSKAYKNIVDSVIYVSFVDKKQPSQLLSQASGVVILDGYHVLTCSHCISNNPIHQNGYLNQDNNWFEFAEIVYNNPSIDIAVLKFKNKIANPVKIIDSQSMEIGMECFVVGFPNSLPCKTFLSSHIATEIGLHFLLDCSVNHGNSGGPLFNAQGELIGIVNAKHGGINNILEQLLNFDNQGMSVKLVGVDPIAVFKEIILSMKQNLNLGIGYAVKTSEIKKNIPYIY